MKQFFSHHFLTYIAPLRTVRKSCAHVALHDGMLGVISAGVLYTIQYAVGAIENNTPEFFRVWMGVVGGLVLVKVLILTIRKPLIFREFRHMHLAIFSTVLPRIIHSDHNQYEKLGTGKMISLFTSGTDKRLFMTIDIVGEGFKSVIFFSLFLVVLINQGRWMLIGITILLALVVFWISLFAGRQLHHRKQSKERYTQLGRQSVKWLQARIEILQNNKIEYELAKIEKTMERMNVHKVREKRRQGISFDGAEFFLMLGFVGTMFWTGTQIIAGTMSYADMILVVSMGTMAVAEIGKMSYRARSWIEQRVDISKLIDTLDEIAPHRDFSKGKTLILTQGTILLDDVRFGYDIEKPIFTNFSITIPGGTVTALVGPSGGGKSTLIKLIAGHLFAQGGKIFVDGQDREEHNLLDRYNHVGYLTQEPSVFDGTVRENLLYGISNVQNIQNEQIKNTDLKTSETSEISAVLSKAQCQFIYDLPKALDTEIGERGVRLSGGQRQRLAIAKIMLKNPKIILLDEPTSALDSMSEELVSQAMQELFKDRTVVIIAHRLQTVKHADRILYITPNSLTGASEIAEEGTHDELIALGGKYAKMVEVQTGF